MTTPPAARGAATATGDRARASGAELRSALLLSAAWLAANAERIDALNVFPVPDGDTGTNMSLTLQASADALASLPAEPSVGEVAQTVYSAALLAARGNSGVILSQLLRGFAAALAGTSEIGPRDLAAAFEQAAEAAYAALSRPREGTILSVARAAAGAARAAADAGADLPALLEQALHAAAAAVAATPDQLEVLRRAGVVDAGGEGYRVILEGAWLWWTGRRLEDFSDTDATRPHNRARLENLDEASGSTFGFCTELLLRNCDLPASDVKARMEALGDSVLAVGDADLLRVHVHTPRPGQALEFAVDHGTLAKVKVENMQLQHEAFSAAAASAAGNGQAADDAAAASSIGVIAVASGEGLAKVLRSLGARVVQGGQTMNPSVQELVSAVNSAGHQELVILPNNPNIVLTAQRVGALTPHTVAVVPTMSVPQGIGALLAFNFQADLATNVAAMGQAARAVHTVEVTRAVRDAEVDGQAVRAGDVLGIYDGRVAAIGATAEEALLRSLDQASMDALEIVTLYVGAEATDAEAQAIAARVREAHPGLAVEVVPGGQPHYPYVVSLE